MCIFSIIMDNALVIITAVLAVFTGGLFGVAYWSLKKQGDYYKATTRPFVNLVGFPKNIMDYNKSEIELNYDFKNYGNTPAKDVQYESGFLSDERREYKKDFMEGEYTYLIFPDETITITKEKFAINISEEKEAYLHIAITYKDMAKKTHYTLRIYHYSTDNQGILQQPELIYSNFD